MQDDISGWTEWNAHFDGIEEISSPSELHGLLTGIVCVTQAPTTDEWSQILNTLNVPALQPEALESLTDEAEDVAHALSDDELDYLPMLPDDSHLLVDRVQALADWCAGVVLGFGLASGHIRGEEQELIEKNQAEVVERGRAENATIQSLSSSYAIADWLQLHLDAMRPVATLLDEMEQTQLYADALTLMQQRIDDPQTTLSAQVIRDMLQAGGTWRLGSQLAEQHTQTYQDYDLTAEKQAYFETLVEASLKQQQQLEQTSQPTFTEYLANFR